MEGKGAKKKGRAVNPAPLEPRVPMERFETVRQEIVEVLTRFGPMSARELSAEVRATERDVLAHLGHIRQSLSRGDLSLIVIPPECRKCGFVFEDRKRMSRPGKCPNCRGTSIEEPLFRIG